MAFTFAGPGAQTIANAAPGTTRWNTNSSIFEVWDGAGWQLMSAGGHSKVTMKDMVEQFEDEIGQAIDQGYADNATIKDAYKEWKEANKRFKIVLALAENKD